VEERKSCDLHISISISIGILISCALCTWCPLGPEGQFPTGGGDVHYLVGCWIHTPLEKSDGTELEFDEIQRSPSAAEGKQSPSSSACQIITSNHTFLESTSTRLVGKGNSPCILNERIHLATRPHLSTIKGI